MTDPSPVTPSTTEIPPPLDATNIEASAIPPPLPQSDDSNPSADEQQQKQKSATRARSGAMKRRISKKNLGQGKIQSIDQLLFARKWFKDYEDTLTNLMNTEDPLKELFIISKDDFTITKEDRIFREAILCVPDVEGEVPIWIAECVRLYKRRHWKLLTFRSSEFGRSRSSSSFNPQAVSAARERYRSAEGEGGFHAPSTQAIVTSSPSTPSTRGSTGTSSHSKGSHTSSTSHVSKGTSSSSTTKSSHHSSIQRSVSSTSVTSSSSSSSSPAPTASAANETNEPDSVNPSVLNPYTADDFARDAKARTALMDDLFSFYDTSEKRFGVQEMIDFSRVLPKRPFPSASAQKLDLLVEVGELQLSGVQNEPLFCTLALHDISTRQRLTEDFHFELNVPNEEPDVWTTRRALFTLTGEPNESIYLVLRIHRIYQDDEKEKSGGAGFNFFGLLRRRKRTPPIETALVEDTKEKRRSKGDVKQKDKKKDRDKDKEKDKQHLKAETRVGSEESAESIVDTFRQPYAWGAVPLFSSVSTGTGAGGGTNESSSSSSTSTSSVFSTSSSANTHLQSPSTSGSGGGSSLQSSTTPLKSSPVLDPSLPSTSSSVTLLLPSTISNLAPAKTASDDSTLYDVLSNDKEYRKIKFLQGFLTLKLTKLSESETRPTNTYTSAGVPLRASSSTERGSGGSGTSTPRTLATTPHTRHPSSSTSASSGSSSSAPSATTTSGASESSGGSSDALSRTTSRSVVVSKVTSSTSLSHPIREVQELPPRTRDVYLSYLNFLYVYPLHATLKNMPKAPGAVQLQVILRFTDTPPVTSSDETHNATGRRDSASSESGQLNEQTMWSLIQTGEKRVEFCDAFRFSLPAVLDTAHNPKAHLLFIFYQVDGKKYKRTPIGFAFLPLLQGGHFQINEAHEEVSLMVCYELPANYLDEDVQPQIKWQEGKKRVFTLRLQLVSSVYTQDPHLNNFFYQLSPQNVDSTLNPGLYLGLLPAIKQLTIADQFELLRFLPVVLNLLIKVMCSADPNVGKEAFYASLYLIKTVNTLTKNVGKFSAILRAYIAFIFENPKLSDKEITSASSSSSSSSAINSNVAAVGSKNAIKVVMYPYEAICKHYLALLTQGDPYLVNFDLNWVLFGLIVKSMALKIHARNEYDTPRKKRFSEEFITSLVKLVLNLLVERDPGGLDYIMSLALFIKDLFAFIDRGIVLSIITKYIDSTRSKTTNPLVHTFKYIFLKIITNYEHFVPLNTPTLLSSFKDTDLIDMGRALKDRHYLAGILIDEVSSYYYIQLKTEADHSILRSQAILVLRSILAKHECDPRYREEAKQARIAQMYFPYILVLIEDHTVLQTFPTAEVEEWLICFLYILKHLSRGLLRSWWTSEPQKRITSFFNLLELCVKTFAKGPLARQVDLVVLDLLAQYVYDFRATLNEENNPILRKVVFLVQRLFAKSETLADDTNAFNALLYAPLVPLIQSCPRAIFADVQAEYVDMFTLEFLRHCNLLDTAARRRALNMLLLLLVKNYQEMGNTFRTKNGATVAISKMVGKGTNKRTEFEPLQKALIALRQYVQTTDPCASASAPNSSSGSGSGSGSFPKHVDDVVSNILNLIEYSVKIDLYSYDQEMIQDLYYKISLSFVHTPDLRLAWLDNLANYHVKNENLEEAAQCKIHIASLIAQYLEKQRVFLKKLPPDFALFPFVSPFLKEEHTQWEPPAQLESQNWTVKKLVQVLHEAIELFDKATAYELCMEIYMLLDQIHKAQRQRKYEDIIANLNEYKELCDRLVDTNNPPDRLYPVYYRVGFYGALWEDLNQKEFIYKMSAKYNLSAFKKHLLDQYSKKFGNKVEVLTSNEDINVEKLDPKKCYIQIAAVSPHFTHEEAEERGTRFEQNFNVNKFVFEQGFTDGGKGQTDDLAQQKKKKTLFTTRLPLPYVKTRVEVVNKEVVILSPIENAIELIVRQTAKVTEELLATPPRIKSLQQVIQGSVVPMVNPGPLRICEIFLAPGTIKNNVYDRALVHQLMNAMEKFVRQCGFAIKFNNSLIDETHKKFQEMVEKCYAELSAKVKERIASLRNEK